jgi:hypothetical protein
MSCAGLPWGAKVTWNTVKQCSFKTELIRTTWVHIFETRTAKKHVPMSAQKIPTARIKANFSKRPRKDAKEFWARGRWMLPPAAPYVGETAA